MNGDLRRLLLERSVRRGHFTLASGAHSSYYIDCRLTTMSATGQALIGPLALQAIRSRGWAPAAVGGMTMGADPIAYAIARASVDSAPQVDAFSIRKEAKDHGTRRQIEGNFDPDQPVVLIEDVITTGGSALAAAEAVREAGGDILGLLALVDRMETGRERIERAGIEVVALTTTKELGLHG